MGRGHLGGSRPGRRRARKRPAGPGRAEGPGLRPARADEPRVVAVRLRAGARRGCRRADLFLELGSRHAVRPRALGGGGRPRRGRGSARQGRRVGRRARHLVLGARRAARTRTGVRRRAPDCAERAGRLDRRGRALHVHLHLGDDRPAEGLHDPPPQLLRDGAEGRRDGRPAHPARRRDAALPAAGTQLRTSPPSLRRLHRLHDRVPARPASRRARS